MNINQINEQAKQSLKKYFKNAYELENNEVLGKELTYDQMMNMIQGDIKKQEERLHELNTMKKVLEHDAKGVYEYVFGKNNEIHETVHHDSVAEMREKLNKNMSQQFLHVHKLKQKAMQK